MPQSSVPLPPPPGRFAPPPSPCGGGWWGRVCGSRIISELCILNVLLDTSSPLPPCGMWGGGAHGIRHAYTHA